MREARKRADERAVLHPQGHAARALTAFGVLVAFAIVAITAYEIVAQREDAYLQASHQLAGINVALAEHTERVVAATDFVVADVAAEIAERLDHEGLPSAEALRKLLHDHTGSLPMLASLIYADGAGTVIAHSHRQIPSPTSIADRSYFLAQRQQPNRGLFIGEPVVGRFTPRALIALSRAVVDARGRFRGVVSAGLEADYFAHFYRDVVNFDGGSVVLARRDDGVLARYPESASPVAHRVGHLVDSRAIDRFPLLVTVAIDEERLLAPWRRSALRLGVTGVLGIAVVYWLLATILARMRIEASQARRLAQSEEQFRVMFDRAADAMFLHDLGGRIVMANRQACESLGYAREELIGRHVGVIDAHQSFRQVPALMKEILAGRPVTAETELRRKDGSTFPIEARLGAFTMGEERLVLALARDISERRAYQARLEQQANHDMLTGLPNRMLFLDRLQTALAAAKRNRRSLVLLFIDLDGFKTINDTRGHAAGDQLLIESGRRIAAALREADTVARYGGDEFVVLLPELDSTNDGERVSAKIAEAFLPPFDLAGRPATVRPSIGIARYPNDGEDADGLLGRADAAMYRAKEAGRQ